MVIAAVLVITFALVQVNDRSILDNDNNNDNDFISSQNSTVCSVDLTIKIVQKE